MAMVALILPMGGLLVGNSIMAILPRQYGVAHHWNTEAAEKLHMPAFMKKQVKNGWNAPLHKSKGHKYQTAQSAEAAVLEVSPATAPAAPHHSPGTVPTCRGEAISPL